MSAFKKKQPEPDPIPQGEPVPSQESPVTTPDPEPKPSEARPLEEIPAEGNNIADVRDRAYADTPPANDQPPVEKTFVPPPDAHTVNK